MNPTPALARATGCRLSALRQILKKGEGAYYSSGSRPNQTPQSWAHARLGSALTGGPSSRVDFSILKKGCAPKSRPLRFAKLNANKVAPLVARLAHAKRKRRV
jgi:hypothetical protein